MRSVGPKNLANRRHFIGGSDARIIMGDDETALLRLWREKRGEIEPEDLSRNLIVQLGTVTEEPTGAWYEANTGQSVVDVQKHFKHPALRWMAATLDGRVQSSGAVFEAKFMLPWSFSEEAAAEKYMTRNCSITCGWWRRRSGCSVHYYRRRQVGQRSRPMPIRFTSILYLPPSGSSGGASKVASRRPLFGDRASGNHVSRRCVLSI